MVRRYLLVTSLVTLLIRMSAAQVFSSGPQSLAVTSTLLSKLQITLIRKFTATNTPKSKVTQTPTKKGDNPTHTPTKKGATKTPHPPTHTPTPTFTPTRIPCIPDTLLVYA